MLSARPTREHSRMDATPRKLISHRAAAPLAGTIAVPGDKSISHRALMFGALAVGETRITGLLQGEDVLRTAAAMRALGAEVAHDPDGTWRVAGRGIGGLTEPADVLDMGNSGTAARLLCGILASHPIFAVMTGDASLRRRPMRRVTEPLAACGARFAAREGGRLPLAVEGARDALPLDYRVPVPSAQVKSAVLLCGLNAPGITRIEEPEATRDHSENMLRHFGASVQVDGGRARADHRAARPAGTARRRRRGAGRSVLRRVPDRCGAAGAGVAADHPGRRAERNPLRAVRDAGRDGRRHRHREHPGRGRRAGRRPGRHPRRVARRWTCRGNAPRA